MTIWAYSANMELFLFWVILSGLAAFYASTKNRSTFGWLLLSLLISPIITLIFLAILPRRGETSISSEVPLSLEAKLKEIEKLKEAGLVSEEEYSLKRKSILESD